MYQRKRLGPLRTVAIWNSELGRYSGGINVQYEWQKKSVPEVASAIWSESAIGGGGVRYRRFHCYSKSLCIYMCALTEALLPAQLRPLLVAQTWLQRLWGGGH